MRLRDEAAACLRVIPGQAVTATELVKRIIAANPDKYRGKLQRSRRMKTDDELLHQVRRELSSDHAKLLADNPHVSSTSLDGHGRIYQWND